MPARQPLSAYVEDEASEPGLRAALSAFFLEDLLAPIEGVDGPSA
jgi:hypothetical protein